MSNCPANLNQAWLIHITEMKLGTKNQSGRCTPLNIIESWQLVVKEIPSCIHTQVNQSLQKWLPELFLLSSDMPAVHQLHKVLQCTPHLSSCIPKNKKKKEKNRTHNFLCTLKQIIWFASFVWDQHGVKIRKSPKTFWSPVVPSLGVSHNAPMGALLPEERAPHDMRNDGCKGEYESHSQDLTFGESLFISSRVVKKIESSRRDGKSNNGDFAVPACYTCSEKPEWTVKCAGCQLILTTMSSGAQW